MVKTLSEHKNPEVVARKIPKFDIKNGLLSRRRQDTPKLSVVLPVINIDNDRYRLTSYNRRYFIWYKRRWSNNRLLLECTTYRSCARHQGGILIVHSSLLRLYFISRTQFTVGTMKRCTTTYSTTTTAKGLFYWELMNTDNDQKYTLTALQLLVVAKFDLLKYQKGFWDFLINKLRYFFLGTFYQKFETLFKTLLKIRPI